MNYLSVRVVDDLTEVWNRNIPNTCQKRRCCSWLAEEFGLVPTCTVYIRICISNWGKRWAADTHVVLQRLGL